MGMELAVGIVGVLGTALGLLVWWLKRRASEAEKPEVQHGKRMEEADRAVAKGDAVGVNRQLESMLRRLPDRDRDPG